MKKVIFNIGYNGCVLDDGVKYKSREDELKWEVMEEEIVDRCKKLLCDGWLCGKMSIWITMKGILKRNGILWKIMEMC